MKKNILFPAFLVLIVFISGCTQPSNFQQTTTTPGQTTPTETPSISTTGKLYIGTSDYHVYSYDGSTVTDIGCPSGHSINSMAVYNNKLYIGTSGNYVYSYDGSTCIDLGEKDFYYTVSMAVYNNKLYFSYVDMLHHKNSVYSYDGSTWTDIGGNTSVFSSLVVYNNKLYLGGYDYHAYSYDGSTWTDLGDQGGTIYSMVIYDNKLYAVVINQTLAKLKFYDGLTWTDLGRHNSYLYLLTVYNNKLYAFTFQGVKYYDGTKWISVDYPCSIYSMAVYNNKLYAGCEGGHVHFYDGSTWTDLGDYGKGYEIRSMAVYNPSG